MKLSICIVACSVALIDCSSNDSAPPYETLARHAPGQPPSTTDTSPAQVGDPLARTSAATVLSPSSLLFERNLASWSESWWRWTFSVPAERNPELVLDSACDVGQSDSVFFVPSYESTTFQRTCRVPAGKPVLVPLAVIINDYPCPDPAFEPAPGQSLEAFLTAGAKAYNDLVQGLQVTVDGEAIDVAPHRHTSRLFQFTANRSLVGILPDTCLQSSRQPGVSDGWWLALRLAPGPHVVHVLATDPAANRVDQTYRLNAARGTNPRDDLLEATDGP
jgi:hypothetical protein